MEIKTEDDSGAPVDREQDNHGTEQQHEQDSAAQAEQVKVEADKGGNYSRKRPYEENRGYGYYEHREDKRWLYIVVFNILGCFKLAQKYNTLVGE